MALDTSVAVKISANVQGDGEVNKLGRSLERLGKQGEMSARQIAQAYRQLPAQLQDVAISLAGGQNPLMVLLQQGSQVATQFGGVGSALRALGGMFSVGRLAIGGFATALGGLAYAAYEGYQENIRLQRALATTGNYAGMTADMFESSAARIQAASRATAGASKELLMGAVGSAAFGPGSIETVTTAMARLQSLTGQSSEEIVKLFAGMSKGVANWAVEANKSFNFLSVDQYKYIKQLEDMGRQEEAMIAASKALNDALSQRSVQLGYLERAWMGLKSTASDAWSAMLNIGKPSTTGDELRALEQRLAASDAIRRNMRLRGQPVPEDSPELKQLRAQIEALREVGRLERKSAETTAKRAQENQSAIKKEIEAETKKKEAARETQRAEIQRVTMLESLNEEVQKLIQGELAVEMARMERLGATEQEIAQYKTLYEQKLRLQAADRQLEEDAKEARQLEEQAARRRKQLEEEAVRNRERVVEAGKRVYDETRTPAEKLNTELARLNDLLQQGVIDWDTYSRAVFKAQDEFDDLGKKGADTMADLKQAIEGWGRQATDTFVEFAFTGKASFKDMVSSILQDIARMMVYRNVMQPLMTSIGGLFGFANGGVMTPGGPLPLNTYARGGIANSPQVALFGEGRMPEAYVPLPDGRTIPVTMEGGGGTSVVVNVNMETGQAQAQGDDQRGTDLGLVIASVVKQELINQRRPGGLLAAA